MDATMTFLKAKKVPIRSSTQVLQKLPDAHGNPSRICYQCTRARVAAVKILMRRDDGWRTKWCRAQYGKRTKSGRRRRIGTQTFIQNKFLALVLNLR